MLLYLFILALIACIAAAWVCCALGFGVAVLFKQCESARQIAKIWGWMSVPTALAAAFVWLVFFPPAFLVYRAAFGESPTDVQNLQSSSDSGFDGESTFLRFQAAPLTIAHLASLKRLPLSTSIQDFHALGATPAWWKPNPAISSVYALEQQPKSYSYRGTILICEAQTQTAYYAFSSVN